MAKLMESLEAAEEAIRYYDMVSRIQGPDEQSWRNYYDNARIQRPPPLGEVPEFDIKKDGK